MQNPLASTLEQSSAVALARLYVLTRDAYLSAPAVTTGKLAALDELRRVAGRSICAAGSAPGGSGGGSGVASADRAAILEIAAEIENVRGVRLVELLRAAMHEVTGVLDADARALALLEVLLSTTPPTGFGWAASPVHLACDAAGYLAPELSTLALHRLAKAHRARRRLLTTGARFGLSARALIEDPTGPETAVADMLGEVLGVGESSARCAAILLIDGGSIDTGRGIAGGAVLDTLRGFHGPDAFVGTALGRVHPTALVHELASLECALKVRPGLKSAVAGTLEALREDLASTQGRSGPEALRLRASRRAVELAVVRMGAGERGRLGALTSRRHLPRPGSVAPATG